MTFKRPDWRAESVKRPLANGLADCVKIPQSGSACIGRHFSSCELVREPEFPAGVEFYLEQLDYEDRDELIRIVRRKIKKPAKFASDYNSPVWNLSKVSQLVDPHLRRLILHLEGVAHDQNISKAIAFSEDAASREMFRFFGYCVFAGLDDKALHHRWKLPVGVCAALRVLFFDFTHVPKDRVVTMAYLRQLLAIDCIDEQQFGFYKRVFELGEIGLTGQLSYHLLSDDEKSTVKHYLSNSLVTNTLELQFSVKSSKDALAYANVAAKFGQIDYQYAKLRQEEAKTEMFRATIDQKRNALPKDDGSAVYSQEELALIERMIAVADNRPHEVRLLTLDKLVEAGD